MRLLLLHAEHFEYETQKKALKSTPDPPGRGSCSNCLVAMITVEEDDNILAAREAASSIVDVLSRVKAEAVMLYPYAHLSSKLAPPSTAVDLLHRIEEYVSSSGVPVKRSPFGWYKRFSITVYGHPLSELSREIRSDPVYYVKEGNPISLSEAISRELLPDGLAKPAADKDVLEVMNRLGVEPLSGSGLEIMYNIVERVVGSLASAKVYHLLDGAKLVGLELVRLLLKSCAAATDTPSIVYIPGDRVIVVRQHLDNLLKSIYSYSGMMELGIGEEGLAAPRIEGRGRLLLYKMSDGSMIPLGAQVGEMACVGPLRGLIAAIVDSEMTKRRQDDSHVPMLPPWMHFINVALIPVSEEQVGMATRIGKMLAKRGARVAILSDTSTRLGLRIRRVAQLWVPIIGVIGKREEAEGVVTIRRRWEPGSQEAVTPEELLSEAENMLGEPRLVYL